MGELARSVMNLEKMIEEDEDIANRLGGNIDLYKLDADVNSNLIMVAESINANGANTAAASVDVVVVHNTSTVPSFSSIDYTNNSSMISQVLLKSTTNS